ncbi:MAG: flagellar basal body rod protein FlgC [candidate division Zixibacteria bacterium]|nr:flagellar basal body rod protein FlgC [candidate division Zixibacteria bacterium]
MSGLFSSIEVSASGMTLQRRKMDVVAQNIANAETTKTKDGTPYRRKRVLVSEAEESIPFKMAMSSARTKLARTNHRHLISSPKNSSGTLEISKTEANEIEDPASSFRLVHDPDHPDADVEGFVKMPDIEIVNEMVDMMAASRAYEANTMAISTAKEMAKNALDI